MKNISRAMRRSSWDHPWTKQARTSSAAEPTDVFSALVCLGAGVLGATVLTLFSGTLTYSEGTLAVRDERALAMAAVVGVIGIILMWFFKAKLLEEVEDGTPLLLFLSNSGVPSRYPNRPIRFGSPEVHLLRQLAGARRSSVNPAWGARSADQPRRLSW